MASRGILGGTVSSGVAAVAPARREHTAGSNLFSSPQVESCVTSTSAPFSLQRSSQQHGDSPRRGAPGQAQDGTDERPDVAALRHQVQGFQFDSSVEYAMESQPGHQNDMQTGSTSSTRFGVGHVASREEAEEAAALDDITRWASVTQFENVHPGNGGAVAPGGHPVADLPDPVAATTSPATEAINGSPPDTGSSIGATNANISTNSSASPPEGSAAAGGTPWGQTAALGGHPLHSFPVPEREIGVVRFVNDKFGFILRRKRDLRSERPTLPAVPGTQGQQTEKASIFFTVEEVVRNLALIRGDVVEYTVRRPKKVAKGNRSKPKAVDIVLLERDGAPVPPAAPEQAGVPWRRPRGPSFRRNSLPVGAMHIGGPRSSPWGEEPDPQMVHMIHMPPPPPTMALPWGAMGTGHPHLHHPPQQQQHQGQQQQQRQQQQHPHHHVVHGPHGPMVVVPHFARPGVPGGPFGGIMMPMMPMSHPGMPMYFPAYPPPGGMPPQHPRPQQQPRHPRPQGQYGTEQPPTASAAPVGDLTPPPLDGSMMSGLWYSSTSASGSASASHQAYRAEDGRRPPHIRAAQEKNQGSAGNEGESTAWDWEAALRAGSRMWEHPPLDAVTGGLPDGLRMDEHPAVSAALAGLGTPGARLPEEDEDEEEGEEDVGSETAAAAALRIRAPLARDRQPEERKAPDAHTYYAAEQGGNRGYGDDEEERDEGEDAGIAWAERGRSRTDSWRRNSLPEGLLDSYKNETDEWEDLRASGFGYRFSGDLSPNPAPESPGAVGGSAPYGTVRHRVMTSATGASSSLLMSPDSPPEPTRRGRVGSLLQEEQRARRASVSSSRASFTSVGSASFGRAGGAGGEGSAVPPFLDQGVGVALDRRRSRGASFLFGRASPDTGAGGIPGLPEPLAGMTGEAGRMSFATADNTNNSDKHAPTGRGRGGSSSNSSS